MNETKLQENKGESRTERYIRLYKEYKAKNQPKEKIGRVEEGEKYYYIDIYCECVRCDIEEKYSTNDFRYALGNYFKTEEEAKKALEKIKIYTRLKRFAEEHNYEKIDWDIKSNQNKWYIWLNYGKVDFNMICGLQEMGQVYFTSRDLAVKAVCEIGEENIKKLFD